MFLYCACRQSVHSVQLNKTNKRGFPKRSQNVRRMPRTSREFLAMHGPLPFYLRDKQAGEVAESNGPGPCQSMYGCSNCAASSQRRVDIRVCCLQCFDRHFACWYLAPSAPYICDNNHWHSNFLPPQPLEIWAVVDISTLNACAHHFACLVPAARCSAKFTCR
jgi:hypothetical protein